MGPAELISAAGVTLSVTEKTYGPTNSIVVIPVNFFWTVGDAADFPVAPESVLFA